MTDRLQDRFYKAMNDVTRMFSRPRDLLDDREFDRDQKRRLLKQWEYDLRDIQVATEEHMAGPSAETGRNGETLREVRNCLRKLGDGDTPERSASHKQGG
jgi:hypothetical protein